MATLLDHQCNVSRRHPSIHPDPQHDTQRCEWRIAFNKLHRKDSLWCNPNVCTRQAKIYDGLDDMINRIIGWLPESTMTFERDQTQTVTSWPHHLHLLSGTGNWLYGQLRTSKRTIRHPDTDPEWQMIFSEPSTRTDSGLLMTIPEHWVDVFLFLWDDALLNGEAISPAADSVGHFEWPDCVF